MYCQLYLQQPYSPFEFKVEQDAHTGHKFPVLACPGIDWTWRPLSFAAPQVKALSLLRAGSSHPTLNFCSISTLKAPRCFELFDALISRFCS